MTLFFPGEYLESSYHRRYLRLPANLKLMIQREFVGVSWLRRFYLLKSQGRENDFRAEQVKAGRFLHRKLTLSRLLWHRRDLVEAYLPLILRHYLFGFFVQLAERKHALPLPPPSPGCYWEAPANLVVLGWMNRHSSSWKPRLEKLCRQLLAAKIRHHFIYCLECGILAYDLFDRPGMKKRCRDVKANSSAGNWPIGLEMEFSNLGRRAVDTGLSRELISRDPFHNFEYYSDFKLEDVSWRLGGYVDTHEHGRRLFSLRRHGGFFEYSLVRVDYPRTYTLPLTTDPALAAAIIDEGAAFIEEIKPHSLHLNIEKRSVGEKDPKLEDFLCLLLLGGDFVRDQRGKLRESRFADRELHRIIKIRKHLCLLTQSEKEVVEYAFLRLRPKAYDYLNTIFALKGFQGFYRLPRHLLDFQTALTNWAEAPKPLAETTLANFIANIGRGLKSEGAYSDKTIHLRQEIIRNILEERQARLKRI